MFAGLSEVVTELQNRLDLIGNLVRSSVISSLWDRVTQGGTVELRGDHLYSQRIVDR